eukprot:3484271-Prymnesium_polylepis.1
MKPKVLDVRRAVAGILLQLTLQDRPVRCDERGHGGLGLLELLSREQRRDNLQIASGRVLELRDRQLRQLVLPVEGAGAQRRRCHRRRRFRRFGRRHGVGRRGRRHGRNAHSSHNSDEHGSARNVT